MRQLPVGSDCTLFIGSGLLSDQDLFARAIGGPTALLVRGSGVPDALAAPVRAALNSLPLQWREHELPDGEEAKTLGGVAAIWDRLLALKHGRDTTLIALGGGVTGDMVGYAAAGYQRGVRWLNLPTTLLAQVDASIGGKTGVNHALGKNMIGAFHPPVRVLADLHTLRTLPGRHLRAGLAEVIKHGIIADSALFAWLEDNIGAVSALEPDTLAEAVHRSCAVKADIVGRDPKEQGERALLNYGHTFGHAIETHQNYAGLLHGEAVAVGMSLAAIYSARHCSLPATDAKRIEHLLQAAGLPTSPPADMTGKDFITHMQLDKKAKDGQMRLVLLEAIGKARLVPLDNQQPLITLLTSSCDQ